MTQEILTYFTILTAFVWTAFRLHKVFFIKQSGKACGASCGSCGLKSELLKAKK